MVSLLHAIGLLTIIPVDAGGPPAEGRMGRVTAAFPLAGAALALIAWVALGAWRYATATGPGATVGDASVEAGLLLILLAWCTGAFHLDGLADTCDGLGARRGRERALEIMRDSRVGAFGVVVLVLDLILKWALLASLPTDLLAPALALSLVCGRWGMTVSCARGVYARPDGVGLGASCVSDTGWRHVLVGAFVPLAFAVAWAIHLPAPNAGFAALCGVFAASLLLTRFVSRRLGGVTGDTLGAVNELCETVALLIIHAAL